MNLETHIDSYTRIFPGCKSALPDGIFFFASLTRMENVISLKRAKYVVSHSLEINPSVTLEFTLVSYSLQTSNKFRKVY